MTTNKHAITSVVIPNLRTSILMLLAAGSTLSHSATVTLDGTDYQGGLSFADGAATSSLSAQGSNLVFSGSQNVRITPSADVTIAPLGSILIESVYSGINLLSHADLTIATAPDPGGNEGKISLLSPEIEFVGDVDIDGELTLGGEAVITVANAGSLLATTFLPSTPSSLALGTATATNRSIAAGNTSTATLGSIAIGGTALQSSVAMVTQSFAEYYSAAIGFRTNALGHFNTAIGYQAESGLADDPANTYMATAFGPMTKATAAFAFAAGPLSEAHSPASMSFGLAAKSYAEGSSATGAFTEAHAFSSFTTGSYNDLSRTADQNPNEWEDDDELFVIGSGQSEETRSNAVTILKNGNVGVGTLVPSAPLHVAGDAVIEGMTEIQVPAKGGISMGPFTAQ